MRETAGAIFEQNVEAEQNTPDSIEKGLPTRAELQELLKHPNTKRFWGRFQRLLYVGGLALALGSCGPSRREIEQMPQTKVEDLAKGLDAYRERGYIKTRGIPEYVGAKDVSRYELDSIEFGDTEIPYLKTVTKRTDFFKLHANPDTNSPTIDMIADGGESEYVFIKELPKGSGLKGTHEYEVTGKIADATDAKGKKGVYFELHSIKDVTIEEFPTIQKKK